MLLLDREPLVLGPEWSREVHQATEPCSGWQQPTRSLRRATLLLWTLVVGALHLDRGITMMAAMDVLEGGSITYVVTLFTWHSLGLAVGNAFAGALLQRWSAKGALLVALLVEAAALLVLGLQIQLGLVVSGCLRLICGICAGIPLVFLPLWVDEYGPSEANTQWLALMQMAAPLGQMTGVFVAAAVTSTAAAGSGISWPFAFAVQGAMLVLLAVRLALVPSSQIDVASIGSLRARLDSLTQHPAEGSQLGGMHGTWREIREMMVGASRNPLTVSLSTTLCFLHATAAGLALWTGPFLASSKLAPPPMVTVLLAAVTVTCMPMVGIYTGALLCDRVDGFKAGQHAAALRAALLFIVVAAATAPLSGCSSMFVARYGLLTVWLFGSGAFLPICTGVLMTSMPSYLRSFNSASSLVLFLVVGFAISPGVSALLMSCFTKPEEGLAFGVGFALWMTVPAAVLLLLAYAREPKSVTALGLAGVDDLTFTEINYELSRRRMSTAPL
eukprot:TRINITY_DN59276_c0_g1_i1.p1 TRINITY_DN59276_c0_g1~~TRINITY_DN59276_c0_g1_i1.p1  ORF type:complete len:527 (+),score=68.21 TRINITY_DN59276_c0_g1_i1:81-1583(+)